MASSKLALLRNALKPAVLPRGAFQGLPTRSFSTGASDEQDSSSSSSDPFVIPPEEGLVFGKLTNIGRNTLKTDIIHYFEGCDLKVDDLKIKYNQFYNPIAMLVQFPSRPSFDTALRQIMRKGRLYTLAKTNHTEWDLQINYDGKTVLLRTPRNATVEDMERIFSGCNYDASATEIISRQGLTGPTKLTLFRFPTRAEALNAFRLRNRSFCLNTPVMMQVLQ